MGGMRIFILECLNPIDLLEGRSEARALEGICQLLNHQVALCPIRSLQELNEACQFIASIDEDNGSGGQRNAPLCVHIAAHGNSEGLGLGSEDVTWEQLAKVLQALSRLHCYSGPLIVILSACDAGKQSLTSELTELNNEHPRLRPPAYVFVTCDDRLAWDSSVTAWTVFYYLIRKAKLNIPETVQQVLTTVKAAGGAIVRYHRWDSGKKRYLKYEPKESDLTSQLIRTRPSRRGQRR